MKCALFKHLLFTCPAPCIPSALRQSSSEKVEVHGVVVVATFLGSRGLNFSAKLEIFTPSLWFLFLINKYHCMRSCQKQVKNVPRSVFPLFLAWAVVAESARGTHWPACMSFHALLAMSPIWQHPATMKKQVMPAALLNAWRSLQSTAQKHVLLFTNLCTSGITWAFRIWVTHGIRDKEKRNTNTFSFLNLKRKLFTFLSSYKWQQCMQEVCVCVPFHIRGVLLEELSQLSLLKCASVYILEGSLLQMTSISSTPRPQ